MSTTMFLAWEPIDDGTLVARSLVFENDGIGVPYSVAHREDCVVDDAWSATIDGVVIAMGTLPVVLATCQSYEDVARSEAA